MSQGIAGESPHIDPTLIVALRIRVTGADALRDFFAHASPGCAYVVHQDDPIEDFERLTDLEVVRAGDGLRLEADRVYLVPPGVSMSVSDGHLVRLPSHSSGEAAGEAIDTTPGPSTGVRVAADPAMPSSGSGTRNGDGTTQASFQQIAEATPAMMWSVAPNGTTWRNAAMRAFLGLSDHESVLWLGDASKRFIPEEDRLRMESAVRSVLSTGRPWHGEYRLRRNDGELRRVTTVINPLHMKDGSIHSVGVVEDIHDRLMAEASLRELNLELEHRVEERTAELADRNERLSRRNEVLDQFAHAASHDLRAPLRTIRSYISLLEETLTSPGESDSPPASELTARISASAERMQRLLGALLRYSTVGRREFDRLPVDPTESAHAAVEDLQADIRRTMAEVEIETLPSVLGDRDGLTEIFNNVIANSLRYRSDDAPRIAIRGERAGELVRIEVSDNSRGFDPRFEEAVFEPFRRLSAIDEAGSGLGLAICARIVERLGGRISATSVPGVGTTITMELQGTDA